MKMKMRMEIRMKVKRVMQSMRQLIGFHEPGASPWRLGSDYSVRLVGGGALLHVHVDRMTI